MKSISLSLAMLWAGNVLYAHNMGVAAGFESAAVISDQGTVTNLSIPLSVAVPSFNSAAINLSGAGILGGSDFSTGAPLAVRFSSTGIVTVLPLTQTTGGISSVDVNNSGKGLLAGGS